eukprot:363744-Chlamydomonas_euryale.AAC.6
MHADIQGLLALEVQGLGIKPMSLGSQPHQALVPGIKPHQALALGSRPHQAVIPGIKPHRALALGSGPYQAVIPCVTNSQAGCYTLGHTTPAIGPWVPATPSKWVPAPLLVVTLSYSFQHPPSVAVPHSASNVCTNWLANCVTAFHC